MGAPPKGRGEERSNLMGDYNGWEPWKCRAIEASVAIGFVVMVILEAIFKC